MIEKAFADTEKRVQDLHPQNARTEEHLPGNICDENAGTVESCTYRRWNGGGDGGSQEIERA